MKNHNTFNVHDQFFFTEVEETKGHKREILNGVNKLADAVKVTLGAKGKNVMFLKHGKPVITKDGVTVTRHVKSDNKIEQMAIDIVKEASEKTVKSAGDGTTTTIILANAIVEKGLEFMKKRKCSFYELAKHIDELVGAVKEEINNLAFDVKEEEHSEKLLHVASISANDEKIGNFIYNIIQEIGHYGTIEVKKSKFAETKIDTVKGIKFNKGFIAPQFVNDLVGMKWNMQDGVYIVSLDMVIRSLHDIMPYVNHVNGARGEEGKFIVNNYGQVILDKNFPILFMVQDIENTTLQTLINNKLKNPNFNVMFVQHDGFGDRQYEIMSDICALTSASIGDKDTLGEVGFAEEVIVDEDTTSILGGEINQELVDDLAYLTETRLADPELAEHELAYLKRRLSTLKGGISVVYVGGVTEVEMLETKDRIDDAAEAVKSAIERGVCIGGGYTILSIAEQLKNDISFKNPFLTVMLDIIKTPFFQLCENAEIDANSTIKSMFNVKSIKNPVGLDVTKNGLVPLETYKVYDSAGVLIDSLTNAAAVAKSILSIERALVD